MRAGRSLPDTPPTLRLACRASGGRSHRVRCSQRRRRAAAKRNRLGLACRGIEPAERALARMFHRDAAVAQMHAGCGLADRGAGEGRAATPSAQPGEPRSFVLYKPFVPTEEFRRAAEVWPRLVSVSARIEQFGKFLETVAARPGGGRVLEFRRALDRQRFVDTVQQPQTRAGTYLAKRICSGRFRAVHSASASSNSGSASA